jgi:hypothetical protein
MPQQQKGKNGNVRRSKNNRVVGSSNPSMAAYAVSQLSKRVAVMETITKPPVVIDFKDAKSFQIPEGIRHKLAHNWRGASRNAPMRVKIGDHFNVVSSANTTLSTVSNLTPLNLTEAKSFASLFDICRVVGFSLEVMTNTYTSATGAPVAPATISHGIVTFDPASAGAYSSVATALDAVKHLGPFSMGALYTGLPLLSKRQKMYVKEPRVVDPGLVTDLLDGNWVGSSDTSVLVGYLKPFVEQCGAAISSHLAYFIIYDIEYAFRT